MTRFQLIVPGTEHDVPVTLRGRQWIVGAGSDCEIRISDPSVQKRQALLWQDEGGLWIRNLGQRRPTRVNGSKLDAERRLLAGDRIEMGNTVVEVREKSQLWASLVHGDSMARACDTVLLGAQPVSPDAGTHTLGRLVASLADVTDVEDTAHLTLDLLQHELPIVRGLVARIGAREYLEVIASVGSLAADGVVRISRTVVTNLRRHRQPLCMLRPVDRRSGALPPAILAAPLMTRGRVDGLVYLEHDETSPRCTPDQLSLAAAITRILAWRVEILDQLARLQEEIREVREGTRTSPQFLGVSAIAREAQAKAEALARERRPLTILGEPGTGKQALARHVHAAGASFATAEIRPFVVLPPPRQDDDPVEEAVAAIDAATIAARGGTLCVYDVEALPKEAHERLAELATLTPPDPERPRLVALSRLDLADLRAALTPSLRRALEGPVLVVPPLRERLEDLPVLCAHLLDEFARETRSHAARVSPRAMDRLRAYEWPGNVAELRQVLHLGAILARSRSIAPQHLPRRLGARREQRPTRLQTLAEVEREHIAQVMSAVGGNKKMAAKVLDIASSTLYLKLKHYGL